MKTIKEMISIMQAYADGKKIEFRDNNGEHKSWENTYTPCWDWFGCDYRIKPEPKFRPYANADECFADVKKHGGWIKAKGLDEYFHIGYIGDGFVRMVAGETNLGEGFDKFLENNVWADDGTPCGKEDENL